MSAFAQGQSNYWIGTQNNCKLFFYGDGRVITWTKNSLENLDNELHVKVKKCVKWKHECVSFFQNQS